MLLLGLACAVIPGHLRFVAGHVYSYDESDYRTVAARSVTDHWLDDPSIPFAKLVVAARDPDRRLSLSEELRDGHDLPYLRHHHGPVYWYTLIPGLRLVEDNEKGARSLGIAWLLALTWGTYLGCLWLGHGRIGALAAAALIAFSTTLNDSFLSLSPHAPYAVIATGALFLMGRALETGKTSLWLGAAAGLSVALATLEYAVFLGATLVCCALVAAVETGDGPAKMRRAAVRAGLVLAIVLLLVWPGSLLKLTLLRNYLVFGYLTLMRPETYGNLSAIDAWWMRAAASPWEWSLLLSLVATFGILLLRESRRSSARAAWKTYALSVTPFAVYSVWLLITTSLNRSPQPRFLASLVASLAVIAGAGMGMLGRRVGRFTSMAGVGAMIALLALNFFRLSSAQQAANDSVCEVNDRLVAYLKEDGAPVRVLAPKLYVPMLQWYFPDAQIDGYPDGGPAPISTEGWTPDVVISSGTANTFADERLGNAFEGYRRETIAGLYATRAVTVLRLTPSRPAPSRGSDP